MSEERNKCRIKITKDGPYIVSGNVPISEKIIVPKDKTYEFKEGRILHQSEQYFICRCGHSKNAPFCDGSHLENGFHGKETASKEMYRDRAKLMEGAQVDLLDDGRCAFARFCHRKNGNAWKLAEDSDTGDNREESITAASNCPAGRLTAIDKDGTRHEPVYRPSIDIIQDPEKCVSAGIFIKGNIQVESTDGTLYETRNRVALCRCGESENKPFCDATHVIIGYIDNISAKEENV